MKRNYLVMGACASLATAFIAFQSCKSTSNSTAKDAVSNSTPQTASLSAPTSKTNRDDVPESNSLSVPQPVPESNSLAVPQPVPESNSLAVPQPVPESNSLAVPQANNRDDVPESNSLSVPQPVPESNSLAVPQPVPESNSLAVPQPVPESNSLAVPQPVPESNSLAVPLTDNNRSGTLAACSCAYRTSGYCQLTVNHADVEYFAMPNGTNSACAADCNAKYFKQWASHGCPQ